MSKKNKKHERLYYPQLTGLRAAAATMIFLSHYWQSFPIQNEYLSRLMVEFHTGVPIFFVLSGFLIGINYLDEFRFDWKWIREFWLKRLVRIYPVYILILVLALNYHHAHFNDWFMDITLLKGFSPQYKFSGIAPSWALTVEMTFYLLVPVILKYWGKIPWLLMALVFGGFGLIYTLFTDWQFVSLYTFFGRSFEFLVGLWLSKKILTSSPRLGSMPIKTVMGAGLMGMCIAMLVLLQNNEYGVGLFHPIGFVINNFGFGLGVMVLIWGLVSETTLLKFFLSSGLMQILGKSSYVFFLIHYTFIISYVSAFVGENYWLNFIGLWAISVAAYLYIEEPVRKFLTTKIIKHVS